MAEKFDLSVVYGDNKEGLSETPDWITYGGNSGHQAVHLAYNWGAEVIILLGYDYGGEGHWFGKHPQPLDGGTAFAGWIKHMGHLARALEAKGVQVINCSRETALQCFPRMNIDEIENTTDTASG